MIEIRSVLRGSVCFSFRLSRCVVVDVVSCSFSSTTGTTVTSVVASGVAPFAFTIDDQLFTLEVREILLLVLR